MARLTQSHSIGPMWLLQYSLHIDQPLIFPRRRLTEKRQAFTIGHSSMADLNLFRPHEVERENTY